MPLWYANVADGLLIESAERKSKLVLEETLYQPFHLLYGANAFNPIFKPL